MKVPVATDPADIEKQNQFWWSLRQDTHQHVIDVPLESALTWPPTCTDDAGKAVDAKVDGFCRVPLPVSGIVRWGFERKADLEAFKTKHSL